MGSSKKKRDKESDRKKYKKEKRDRDGKSRDKSKKRREDDDELLDYALHDAVEVQQNVYDYGHGLSKGEKEEPGQAVKDESSMSIEETNKIRAKLGLKPLVVSDPAEQNNGDKEEEFVHAPPINIAEQESQEKIREKLKEIREKREIQRKLGKVKRLAESDSDDDNAVSWVKKLRKKENEKELAAKRAQLLEEMDEEFGVGELVENVMGNKSKAYTARNLRGLTVEHSSDMIKDNKEFILTLKDSGVLDDKDDVLENVNLTDLEKANKNVELRKKKPGYQAYDEFDETGEQKVVGLLSKYDEEIDGEKKKSFSLGQDGGVNLTKEQELQNIRDKLKNEAMSLKMPELQTQSEYYTEQEMLKFKKPKKRRKIKKRETLKADDLIPLENTGTTDHGSRTSRKVPKNKAAQDDDMEWQMADPDDAQIQGPDMNSSNDPFINEDDDAQLELQLALDRSRRSKLKKENIGAEKVVASLTALSNNMDTVSTKTNTIILDSTSEFCRTLGEIPTYGTSGNRADLDDIDDEMELEGAGDEPGGWEAVKQQDNKTLDVNDMLTSKDANVLDDEPTLGLGIGAALTLVQKKGLIESDKREKKFAGGLALPETVKVIDEEKMRDEERERLRERGRDRERERYNPNAFKEKVGYKPDVKLEYVDEQGRQMNPKEAFRYLSHKFHGKIPGKLKNEKRQKKFAEDLALKKMNAGDTPLNTVALFSEKQKQGQTPYLILSGGGQTFSAGPTIQKGK